MGIITDLAAAQAAPSIQPGMLSSLADMPRIRPNILGQGGALGPGSTGRSIAGYLGDALLRLGGQAPQYAPYVQGKPERDLETLLKQTQLAKAMQPEAPHYSEANNGDLLATDGTGTHVAYHDPTPKVTWITADNGDGTKTLVPAINGVPQFGGATPGGVPQAAAPSGTDLPPGFTIRAKGGAANPGGTFRGPNAGPR
jgi:hypothetical protein